MKLLEKLLEAPTVLLKKMVLLAAIGLGVGAIGWVSHLELGDRGFLWLSSCLAVCCGLKSIMLGRIILKEQYVVMKGRCVSAAPLPFSRFVQVVLCGDDGEEYVCRFEKRMGIRGGQQVTLFSLRVRKLGLELPVSMRCLVPTA